MAAGTATKSSRVEEFVPWGRCSEGGEYYTGDECHCDVRIFEINSFIQFWRF